MSSCVTIVDFSHMQSFYTMRMCSVKMITFPDEIPSWQYGFYHNLPSLLTQDFNSVMSSSSVLSLYHQLINKYVEPKYGMINCENDMKVSWSPLPLRAVHLHFKSLPQNLVSFFMMTVSNFKKVIKF